MKIKVKLVGIHWNGFANRDAMDVEIVSINLADGSMWTVGGGVVGYEIEPIKDETTEQPKIEPPKLLTVRDVVGGNPKRINLDVVYE